MEDKISIIIPVYNAEKYLEKCIISIVKQNYNNWELLLIDDGSTDNSSSICKQFISNDKRIKYIRQSNKGVSIARNTGLTHASGEWIMFVDADDQIKVDTLSKIKNFMKGYDIIRFEAIDSFGKIMKLPSCNAQEYLLKVIQRNTSLAIWGGLYKKSLFIENNITFDPELKYGEDWIVLIQLLKQSKQIYLLKEALYKYNNYNSNSFSNTMSYEKQLNLILCFKKIQECCNGKIPENKLIYTEHIIQFGILGTILKESKRFKEHYKEINNLLPIKFHQIIKDKKLPIKFKVILLISSNYYLAKLINLPLSLFSKS